MTRHTDAPNGEPTDGTERPTEGLVDVPADDRPSTSHDQHEGTVYVHELIEGTGLPTAEGWIGMDAEHTIDAEDHR